MKDLNNEEKVRYIFLPFCSVMLIICGCYVSKFNGSIILGFMMIVVAIIYFNLSIWIWDLIKEG